MQPEAPEYEQSSTARVLPPVQPRKLAKVPFVELADGRLQGVVSSGSDIARVYVSSVEAGSHDYSCSTNNNRPCGGAGSYGTCKHVDALITEAVVQYGLRPVARYLRVELPEEGEPGAWELRRAMNGTLNRTEAAVVFSRFLHHLSYLELPVSTSPMVELNWFPAAGVTA
ncbi:hypothetical protein Afil01_62450 [Actinorhabdospora filicis]|uniref:SWIM-type domain-containing protein n=1 Tax=Actinorhabdospora filicis TaxID=1785913 RepID=A0A9W6SSB1_9ACTN|nr:hypothetical protein [Actinorhabdospora filicis]GLZ81438.1 hypothetical protein Afil01_62450 [Actinorhabdospora filicis]